MATLSLPKDSKTMKATAAYGTPLAALRLFSKAYAPRLDLKDSKTMSDYSAAIRKSFML